MTYWRRRFLALVLGLSLLALVLLGRTLHFGLCYYGGLAAGAALFSWQQWLIRARDYTDCFRAFENNHYFGIAIFIGILLEYATAP